MRVELGVWSVEFKEVSAAADIFQLRAALLKTPHSTFHTPH